MIDIDRADLRTEAERCTAGFANSGLERLVAQRIATETALIKRGLLTVNQGGLRQEIMSLSDTQKTWRGTDA